MWVLAPSLPLTNYIYVLWSISWRFPLHTYKMKHLPKVPRRSQVSWFSGCLLLFAVPCPSPLTSVQSGFCPPTSLQMLLLRTIPNNIHILNATIHSQSSYYSLCLYPLSTHLPVNSILITAGRMICLLLLLLPLFPQHFV